MNIQEGNRTSVFGADLVSSDNIPEIIIGNLSGGVNFYDGSSILSTPEKSALSYDFNLFPVPATRQSNEFA